MSSSLQDALERIGGVLGDTDPGASVERVDVDPTGALHVSLARADGPRWFRYSEGELAEVRPETDTRLRLAEALRESQDWELYAYRPGRRVVIARERRGRTVVVKGYRKKRSKPAARLHRIAERVVSRSGFRVPRLLEHDADRECLTFEFMEGDPVALDRPQVFFSIGVALRFLQDVQVDEDLVCFGSAQELEVLDRWSQRHSLAVGHVPAGWQHLRGRLGELSRNLPEAPTVPCHRDLHDGQVLLSSQGPVLLDFDLFCRADPALDLANLLAHLSLRELQKIRSATKRDVEAAGEALLDGIHREDDPDMWDRIRFYQATTFLRLSLVYGLRPRWAHLPSRLIELAELCISELAESAN